MKNAIMKSPHQLHTYGWTTVTIDDLRKGSYYEIVERVYSDTLEYP